MKIGMIRHFKVIRGYPNKIVSSNELTQWINEYDNSDVEEMPVDLLDIEWDKCYSSDMPRAQITAEKCYKGEIHYTKELREIPLSPLFRSDLRLPLFIHLVFIRLAWMLNHKSQLEKKSEVLNRINRFLDQALNSKENVLLVGHGGVMMYIRRELLKRGFKGPNFKRPINGRVYLFEK